MSFKVVLPTDRNTVTVSGLYQWDYGQELEIEAVSIGSEIVEVHFACAGMSEAIVRSCSFSNGVGTVTIPDGCLEQASTITAWIYRISGSTGHTWKTITLPVTARTRPSIARELPQDIADKYTELITEVNEAVENLESGNVTAANAKLAEEALRAGIAGNAENANHAISADSATTANTANSATRARYADEAESAREAALAESAIYASTASALELPAGFVEHTYGEEMESGLYMIRFSIYEREDFLKTFQAVVGVFAVTNASNIYLGELNNGSLVEEYSAYVIDNKVLVYKRDGSGWVEISTTQGHWCNLMYKKICS